MNWTPEYPDLQGENFASRYPISDHEQGVLQRAANYLEVSFQDVAQQNYLSTVYGCWRYYEVYGLLPEEPVSVMHPMGSEDYSMTPVFDQPWDNMNLEPDAHLPRDYLMINQ